MIRFIYRLLLFLFCLYSVTTSHAASSIREPQRNGYINCWIEYNGITHLLDTQTGRLASRNSTLYVPMEYVLRILSIPYEYSKDGQRLTLTKGKESFTYFLNTPDFYYTGKNPAILMGKADLLASFEYEIHYMKSSAQTKSLGYDGDVLWIFQKGKGVEELPKARIQNKIAYTQTARKAEQIITVTGTGKSSAHIALYEKSKSGLWSRSYQTTGFVGKNGITINKKEGDKCTPEGSFPIKTAFGRKENPGAILPYTIVNPNLYWVDDPDSIYYNQMVNSKKVKKDWKSAEHLSSMGPAYDYALVIDSNPLCIPGNGSAIFLHCTVAPSTSGCISITQEEMLRLLKELGEDAYIIIAEDRTNLSRY